MVEGELGVAEDLVAVLTAVVVAEVDVAAGEADQLGAGADGAEEADHGGGLEAAGHGADLAVVAGEDLDLVDEAHAQGTAPRDHLDRHEPLIEDQCLHEPLAPLQTVPG